MTETTSNEVASKAAWLMGTGKKQMEAAIADATQHGASGHAIHLMRHFMELSIACAASALTQRENPGDEANVAIRDQCGL